MANESEPFYHILAPSQFTCLNNLLEPLIPLFHLSYTPSSCVRDIFCFRCVSRIQDAFYYTKPHKYFFQHTILAFCVILNAYNFKLIKICILNQKQVKCFVAVWSNKRKCYEILHKKRRTYAGRLLANWALVSGIFSR